MSWYAGGDEIVQAIVDEREGRAVEVWTGPQVAWQMARGLEGAFGRRVNSPWVWIPLMVAFFVAFFDPRRPFRLLHLDLLVLLSFSLSHVFFNRGEIHTSVPLVYPVLAYLLVRMLVAGWGRRARAPGAPFTLVPIRFLALALVFLVGFRLGLNLTDSNVIDVGYSGVIGADRLTHGEDLYGTFPDENASGDTYGPRHLLLVRAVRAGVSLVRHLGRPAGCPRGGDRVRPRHDAGALLRRPPAARRAGRQPARPGARIRMGRLSVHARSCSTRTRTIRWSRCCVTLAFLALSSPRARGVALALAAAAKFAPLALAPLWAAYDRRRARDALAFALAFGALTVLLWLPVLPDGGVRELWDRTVGFQLGRDSPFSIWGLEDLGWAQDIVKALAVALAVAVAVVPAREDAARRRRRSARRC